ncbi:hypothetical protein LLEC1_04296, partial [Akanthomyces lecanii]
PWEFSSFGNSASGDLETAMYLGYAAAWMDVTTGFVGVAARVAFVQADYYIDPTTLPYATRGK